MVRIKKEKMFLSHQIRLFGLVVVDDGYVVYPFKDWIQHFRIDFVNSGVPELLRDPAQYGVVVFQVTVVHSWNAVL